MASSFTDELRGWQETAAMSDDARRKVWLMHTAAIEIERLRASLAEIVVRTMPYQDDHEGWPLVAGVHRVAHDALAESR